VLQPALLSIINVVMERLQLPKFSSQDFAFLGEWTN